MGAVQDPGRVGRAIGVAVGELHPAVQPGVPPFVEVTAGALEPLHRGHAGGRQTGGAGRGQNLGGEGPVRHRLTITDRQRGVQPPPVPAGCSPGSGPVTQAGGEAGPGSRRTALASSASMTTASPGSRSQRKDTMQSAQASESRMMQSSQLITRDGVTGWAGVTGLVSVLMSPSVR